MRLTSALLVFAFLTLAGWFSLTATAAVEHGSALPARAENEAQARAAVDQATGNRQATYAKLKEIARETLALHFNHLDCRAKFGREFQSLDQFAAACAVAQRYRKGRGLFVTFSRNGKTRACWGSIYPQYPDLVKATVYTTEAALSKDYRFAKVHENEWNKLKAQVTVITSVTPISSLAGQDPMRYGLFVRSGGKGAVLLPGEASDAHYQLVQCKLKAGIQSGQPCQMYRIKADANY